MNIFIVNNNGELVHYVDDELIIEIQHFVKLSEGTQRWIVKVVNDEELLNVLNTHKSIVFDGLCLDITKVSPMGDHTNVVLDIKDEDLMSITDENLLN